MSIRVAAADFERGRFVKVKHPRIYEMVVAQIQELIVTEQLKPGDRLMPERQLGERFGVSRTAVRDAVRVLKERGLLEIKHGSGMYVVRSVSEAAMVSVGLFLDVTKNSYEELHDVRRILEIDMATLAAERATDDDILKLQKANDAMLKNTKNPPLFIEADLAFHLAVAEATHNEIFLIIYNPIIDRIQETRRIIVPVPGGPARAVTSHGNILAGIRNRSKTEARVAMTQHMREVENDIREALAVPNRRG